jgi:hypothetical protein
MSLIVNPHFIGVIDFGYPGTAKRIKPPDGFGDGICFFHRIKDSLNVKEILHERKTAIKILLTGIGTWNFMEGRLGNIVCIL